LLKAWQSDGLLDKVTDIQWQRASKKYVLCDLILVLISLSASTLPGLRRFPFRMGGFRYNPETGNVIYHATKMHGTLNQNFVVFSTPLEALEALSQLIPHRRKHVVRYYGAAHQLVREIYGLRPGHHPIGVRLRFTLLKRVGILHKGKFIPH
jgi:hypothetical protein